MAKSEGWLKTYYSSIGASMSAQVLGMSPWGTRAEAYEKFTNPPTASLQNADMLRGTLLEPIALELLSEQLEARIEPHNQDVFFNNESIPWAHVLPDGWLVVGSGKLDPVEIKVPRPRTWQQYYFRGLPEHYIVAAQHCMAVLGCQRLHFACLCPVTMRILYEAVERDPIAIFEIMEGERDFWHAVRTRRRPDGVPHVSVKPSIGKARIVDDLKAERAARQYLEIKSISGEVQKLLQDATAQLLEAAQAYEEANDCFEVSGVLRAHRTLRSGRLILDAKAALAADPTLVRFQKPTNAYWDFRAYDLTGANHENRE